MNVNGGAIGFDMLFNTDGVKESIERADKQISAFVVKMVNGGGGVEKAFDGLVTSIDLSLRELDGASKVTQKTIKQIEQELDNLRKKNEDNPQLKSDADINKAKALKESLKEQMTYFDQTTSEIKRLEDEYEKLSGIYERFNQNQPIDIEKFIGVREADSIVENIKGKLEALSYSTKTGSSSMTKNYQEAFDAIDKGFLNIYSAIDINKKSLVELENKYKELGEAASEALMKGKDNKFRDLSQQQAAVKIELDERKKLIVALGEQDVALQEYNKQLEKEKTKVDESTNSRKRLRVQLLGVKDEMAKLEQKGKDAGLSLKEIQSTAEFQKLSEEAKRLSLAVNSANQQIKILTSVKGATLQGIVSGMSGLSGAFTTAQGAIGLFADKNEDLQKIMLKVQSLMSITMGLQAVSATLHQTSAFRLTVLTKAQAAYSAAIFATGKALIGFGLSANTARIAAQAFMGVVTLGLGVAITIVVTAITKLVSKFNEAKKATEEIAKSASEQVASLMKLSEQWKRLGDNLDAQKKFLRENGDEIKKLTGKTLDLSQADDLFIKNTGKFIEALILRARAEAQYQKVKEKAEELSKVDKKFEDEYKELAKQGTLKRRDGTDAIDETTGKPMLQFTSQKYSELKAEREKLKKETESFLSEFLKLSESEKQILKDLGLGSEEILEGSIAATEALISELKEKHKKATTDLERNDLAKQIREQEKLLAKMDQLQSDKSSKTGKDPFLKGLEEKKKAYQEYFKWLNAGYKNEAQQEFATLLENGTTYTEYLKNQRDKILGITEDMKKEVGRKMTEMFPGNVDLLARPLVNAAELVKKGWKDAGDGIATVFSSQFGIEDASGKVVEILVSPILPDGKVLSPKELEDYIYNELEGANDILKADKKGIVISVDVDSNGSAGDVLHQLQEQYYLTKDLSKSQKEMLHKLNTAIAEETTKTVMQEFEKDLQAQLNAARSIMEMLKIIEDRRKGLETDDSGLKEQKTKVLDKEQEDVAKKAKDEYNSALKAYSDYLDEKIGYELRYLDKRKELELAIEKETDNERKEILQNRLDTLNIEQKTENGTNYDELLKIYGGFEQKKQKIIDEYDEKRRIAQANNDEKLISELDKAQAKDISSLAFSDLIDTDIWSNLFGNLDELTAKQIDVLVREIESKFNSLIGVFNPVDLSNIRNKLNEAKAILIKDNPFKQVGESLKAIFNGASSDSKNSAQSIKQNWKQLAESTEKSFDFVTEAINSADFLKDAIGEVGATALSSMASVASVALAVSTSIKTAEKASVILLIIQAALVVVQAVSNVIKTIIGNNDKKIDKSIQQHESAIKNLEQAYESLGRAIKKSLGDEVYKNQKASIDNLKLQQQELLKMAELERTKKKGDENKAREYEAQVKEIGDKIEDMMSDMINNIISTDAKTIADQLGDAFIAAFSKGEDAAKAWGDSVKDIVAQIVRNMLIQELLQKPIGSILDKYSKKWVDEDGNFLGFDAVTNSLGGLSSELNSLTTDFTKGFDNFPEEVKKALLGTQDESDINSLSGAVKGITQQQADLLGGTANAMRVNQVESIEIFRDQLLHLVSIDMKIGISNQHLESIDSKISSTPHNPLRAEGII
jgi:hypothetical protein